MTTDERFASIERAKLKRLQAAIELGRRSGVSERTAGEILAEAKARLRRSKGTGPTA